MNPTPTITLAEQIGTILIALGAIARGRTDCGRPLAGETARLLAREAFVESGLDWNNPRAILATLEGIEGEKK